jgi:cobalt-zinc-cadmium efflux system outer membrane protein
MKRALLPILLLACSGAALAGSGQAAGFLPAAVARPLLERDPRVAAARAGLEAGHLEAKALESSPYEWTVNLSRQRRSANDGTPGSREWNAGVERTLRLPAKASADRNIGGAAIAEARARYRIAMRDAAQELSTLWLDWLAAEQGHALAAASLRAAEESFAAVEKRVKAGDAARLDANLARAELAEQRLQESSARTGATAAAARLSARFPDISLQAVAMPAPSTMQDVAGWRERILAESDELMLAQAQLQSAKAQAQRTRADRVPDPTVGVYRASEAMGRERITGISLSIPLPGGARGARSDRSQAALLAAEQEAALKRLEVEADLAANIAVARGSLEALQIAEDGAAAAQSSYELTQKAYRLGEADLQTLLLARRQATTARAGALQAQVAALKAQYKLLVDAHLVWDLKDD